MRSGTARAAPLTIGQLAERSGCSVPTVRFYEEIGLIPKATRTAAGRRTYSEDDAKGLTFIRRCRDFGFGVEQVRDLVALSTSRDRDCVDARDLASSHLRAVRAKMSEMRELERSLEGFVERCDVLCAGGPASECVILEGLAERPRRCGD
jgi:DNA-binding transcriptional MerR regulator